MENSKIRIGKDFNVFWAIHKIVDGQRQPYDLEGKKLQLYYRTSYGKVEVANWKVNSNSIEWRFRGKEQKYVDDYELILVENADQDGMVTVDTCNAFTLVAHSCEERINEAENIIIEVVTLESDVALAPVVKEVGGGASEEDIQEIKNDIVDLQLKDVQTDAKLTELSEENERLKERIEEQDQFIEDLQNTKIDRENDDYYPKMAVGLADNLAGVDVVDSEINFRRSGGGAISDGVARIESIKGNSVVWNQLIQRTYKTTTHNGVTFTVNEDGSVVANGTATAFAYLAVKRISVYTTHKYCVIGGIDNSSATTYYFGDGNNLNLYNTKYVIANPLNNATVTLACRVMQGVTVENIKFDVPKIFDLTQMFGAGNEPTTIEEFYARIPMGVDLNAYNEGEVIHMDVQSIESVGRNAWDEEWENGTFNTTTGENINEPSRLNQVRSKSLIEILPNTQYTMRQPSLGSDGAWVMLFDKEKNIIKGYNGGTSVAVNGNSFKVPSLSPTFITAPNASYMRFYMPVGYGDTYNHDICINISDASINGNYFPYIKRVEDLAVIRKYFPDGMKSAGTAHDEIRYNKETQKWEKVVRIGEVDMGTLNWLYASGNISKFSCVMPSDARVYQDEVLSNMMTSLYIAQKNNANILRDKNIYRAGFYLGVLDSSYTDAATFKAAMSGVILYYELAEPIVTELDEVDQFKDLDYQVWNCGTEKAIAEGKSAPLAADITYGFNAIGKIKELESLVAALRAKVGI